MATDTDIQKLLLALGERIRTRRKALGLTQEKLADITNLSPTYIAKLEAAKKTPSLETLVVLAEALQTDAGHLIRKGEETAASDTAMNLVDALSGLSGPDIEFVTAEVLSLAAYLRKR